MPEDQLDHSAPTPFAPQTTDRRHPLVSVVVPVYNQGEFVEQAISSVLAQRYSPVEVIVVNDGSTDDTPRRLARFEHAVRVIHQSNQGAAAALNRGIRESSGGLVCWLSADDEFLPGKLECQVAALLDHPDAAFAHTGYETVDASGVRIETVADPVAIHPDPFVTVFWANSLNGSTVMLRREAFDAQGGFDESLRADVDADMWLRIMTESYAVGVPGVYVRYRVHSNSLSANTQLMMSSMSVVRRRHFSELVKRVSAGPEPAATFAKMGADVARQGLFDIARRLRRQSLRTGLAPRALSASIAAEITARMKQRPPIHRLGRDVKRLGSRARGRYPG